MKTKDNFPPFILDTRSSDNASIYADDSGLFLSIPGQQTFDFTLLFEDSILSILPSALLLLISPLRILQLWKKARVVKASSYLQATKIVSLSVACLA